MELRFTFTLLRRLCLVWCVAGRAFAQTAPLPKDAVRLDPVVISAAKTGESLQSLPVAATVFTPAAIKGLRIETIRDFERFAPNVSVTTTGQTGASFFNIRGIESNSFIVNRTAVYIDGIPFRELDHELFPDVAAIEILRGPQGTLYGTNTAAGVVVITTRRPGPVPAADLSAFADFFSGGAQRGADLFASAPLRGKNLFVSLAAGARERDAYAPNPVAADGEPGRIRETYARLKFLYTPDATTEVQFLLYGTGVRAPGVYEQDYLPTNRARYNLLYRATANAGRAINRFEQLNEAAKHLDNSDYGAALQCTTRLGEHLQLTAFSSYRREDENEFGIDLDLTALPVFTGGAFKNTTSWNNEVRLGSIPDARVVWVAGLNYLEESKRQSLVYLSGGAPATAKTRQPEGRVTGRDTAAYAQFKTPLGDDRLHLTLGLRGEIAHRTRAQTGSTFVIPGTGTLITPDRRLAEDFNVLLPKAALDYALTPRAMVYASVARGWLPGGFNLEAVGANVNQNLSRYGAEKTWAYEVGAKTTWLDGRVTASAAAFQIEADHWQDYNVLVDNNGVAQSTNIVTSTAEVRSRGFEFELAARLAPGWEAGVTLGVTRARYGHYVFGPAQIFTGNTVKSTPAWDASAGLGYHAPSGWFARADLSLKGPVYLNPENTYREGTTPSLDLALGYETARWSVTAYAKNLTDEYYFNGLVYTNFAFGNDGLFYGPVGPPRTFGVKAGWKF